MARQKRLTDSEVNTEARATAYERAKTWGKYFRQLVREWQYADETGGRILQTRRSLAILVDTNDVSIASWLEGTRYPSRQNCIYVGSAFGKDFAEVLEAAGYAPTQDDSYNTINTLMVAVRNDPDLTEDERQRFDLALVTIIDPVFIAKHPDWTELVRVVLNQRLSDIEKVERIASLVDLTH